MLAVFLPLPYLWWTPPHPSPPPEPCCRHPFILAPSDDSCNFPVTSTAPMHPMRPMCPMHDNLPSCPHASRALDCNHTAPIPAMRPCQGLHAPMHPMHDTLPHALHAQDYNDTLRPCAPCMHDTLPHAPHAQDYNDTLLAIYLASMTKGVSAVNEIVDKFTLAYEKSSRRTRPVM